MSLHYVDYGLPILLVDDDAMVRTVIVEYLINLGFKNIKQAKNVPQALRWVQDPTIKIGLVLSDWEMPGEKGLELLKAIRKNKSRKDLPFVMITSQESIERFKITQAAHWKVTDYLVKPFTCDTLKDRIWKVMEWREENKVG